MKISLRALRGLAWPVSIVLLVAGSALAQQAAAPSGSPAATTSIDGKQLPPPLSKFGGKIGRNAAQSTPYWPPRVEPPKGAPNVLLIITDDVGSDTLTGVDDRDYQSPFAFTGTIDKITLSIDRPKLTPEDVKKLEQAQQSNRASE